MPTATTEPLPLPGPDVPFIDTQTGRVTRYWHDYLVSIDRLVRDLRDEIP